MHPRDNWLEMKVEDWDYDGFQEIVLNNEYFGLLLSPNRGAVSVISPIALRLLIFLIR